VLTRDAVLAMPAGLELDTLVAENVMGLCVHRLTFDRFDQKNISRTWWKCKKCGQAGFNFVTDYEGRLVLPERYSEDMRAAWEVVGKALSTDGHFAFWPSCRFGLEIRFHGVRSWDSEPLWEIGPYPAPLAICRAGLLTTLQPSQLMGE
jgi:hypothetical protein